MIVEYLLNEINDSKPDVVFVGGVAVSHYNSFHIPKDIDIVVNNLNGLEKFGDIIEWNTDYPGSISTRRGHIKRDDYNIDIFIEEKLPPYIEFEGLKYQSRDSLLHHYKWVQDFTPDKVRKYYQTRIELLNNMSITDKKDIL